MIEPIVYDEALDLIAEHQAAGRPVYLVSASPVEIVAPLADHLGVDGCLATIAEVDADGRYTGRVERYCYGPEKVVAMLELAEREGIDLDDSWAYSDSATDMPMLAAVGHPVAVNPDRELLRTARERGWAVRWFVRPVRLRDRIPRPSAAPDGGRRRGLVAVVAAVVTWWWLRRTVRAAATATAAEVQLVARTFLAATAARAMRMSEQEELLHARRSLGRRRRRRCGARSAVQLEPHALARTRGSTPHRSAMRSTRSRPRPETRSPAGAGARGPRRPRPARRRGPWPRRQRRPPRRMSVRARRRSWRARSSAGARAQALGVEQRVEQVGDEAPAPTHALGVRRQRSCWPVASRASPSTRRAAKHSPSTTRSTGARHPLTSNASLSPASCIVRATSGDTPGSAAGRRARPPQAAPHEGAEPGGVDEGHAEQVELDELGQRSTPRAALDRATSSSMLPRSSSTDRDRTRPGPVVARSSSGVPPPPTAPERHSASAVEAVAGTYRRPTHPGEWTPRPT